MTAAVTDRCRYQWRADRTTHTCHLPAGHDGEHACRYGDCRYQPTTTPRERP